MPAYIQFLKSSATNTVTRPNQDLSTGVYFQPERSPELAPAMGDMMKVLDDVAAEGKLLANRFSESSFNEENGDLLRRLATGIKSYRSAALELKKKNQDFKNTHAKIALEPEKAREIRGMLQGMSAVKIFELAVENVEIAAAVLEFPTLLGLTPDLIKPLEEVQLHNALKAHFTNQIPQQPTLENIFPDGGDMKKAEELATANMEKFSMRDDEVKLAEQTILQLIGYYGVIAGTHDMKKSFEMIGF